MAITTSDSSTLDEETEYKIIILGELGVGKTTYLLRIHQGEFVDTSKIESTLGIDCTEYRTTVQGSKVKVVLYEPAGSERFRAITSNYYLHADAAILMYSVDQIYTFENLEDHIDDAKPYIQSDNFVWAIFGNKGEFPAEVKEDRVTFLCSQLHTDHHYIISAKTGLNVEAALKKVVKEVHKQRKGIPERLGISHGQSIVLHRNQSREAGDQNGDNAKHDMYRRGKKCC